MIQKNISMPHPALGITGDIKEGSFGMTCKVKLDKEYRVYQINEIVLNISNSYINKLYIDKKVNFVVKVSCTPTYKTWTFINPKEIRIPENEVDILLQVESFLIAADTIENYCDSSFSDDFENMSFKLEKNDILGLTGAQRIPIKKENEKVSLGSIFRFSKLSPNLETQELHFDFDEDQIVIYYPSINPDFDPVTLLFDKVQGLPFTALSLFIIPALTEAFRIIAADDETSYNEKKWFLIIDSLLPKSKRVDDPFINAQKIIKVGIPINMAFNEIINSKNLAA